MKIEIASQERLKFVKKIEDIFTKEIIGEECLITDESTLTDFTCMFDVSYSIGQSDNGLYLFKIKRVKDLLSNEYEEEIIESEASNEKQEYILKIKNVFGVDITDVYGLKFPDLFLYLYKHIPQLNKKRLGLI